MTLNMKNKICEKKNLVCGIIKTVINNMINSSEGNIPLDELSGLL